MSHLNPSRPIEQTHCQTGTRAIHYTSFDKLIDVNWCFSLFDYTRWLRVPVGWREWPFLQSDSSFCWPYPRCKWHVDAVSFLIKCRSTLMSVIRLRHQRHTLDAFNERRKSGLDSCQRVDHFASLDHVSQSRACHTVRIKPAGACRRLWNIWNKSTTFLDNTHHTCLLTNRRVHSSMCVSRVY